MRIFSLAILFWGLSAQAQAQTQSEPYPDDLLDQIRSLARSIEGDLPQSVAWAKVAESHRPFADIIEGGSDETFVSARTAFQIRYADRTIMLDSGMDEEVHRYYGFGRIEPYFADVNEQVQHALLLADQIIITHEHGDHVAGVIRSPNVDRLAAKTLMNEAQIDSLANSPQLPQIQLPDELADDFSPSVFETLLAVAPGIVAIKSPGHTPGHQMLFVATANDREYLFIGDVAWSLENITAMKPRPSHTAGRIGEDVEALMQQMQWIRTLMDREGLIIVPSHDDTLLTEYAADGVLDNALRL